MSSLSSDSEHNYQPRDIEPSFSEVLAEFDATDTRFLMGLSSYFDKPSPEHMKDIELLSTDVFDAFGEVLRKVLYDASGVIDEESRPALLATILRRMSDDHSRLIADHTDFVRPETDEEKKIALEVLTTHFEHCENPKELADEALDSFKKVRDEDMMAVENFAFQYASSFKVQVKDKLRRSSFEVVKIGTGVLVGLIAYDRFKSKS